MPTYENLGDKSDSETGEECLYFNDAGELGGGGKWGEGGTISMVSSLLEENSILGFNANLDMLMGLRGTVTMLNILVEKINMVRQWRHFRTC